MSSNDAAFGLIDAANGKKSTYQEASCQPCNAQDGGEKLLLYGQLGMEMEAVVRKAQAC